MKNDKTQKPGYETYWGRMTQFLTESNFDTLENTWQEVNLFEQKDAPNHYTRLILEGESIEVNSGKEYLKLKSEYIANKIKSLTSPKTDCIIELGSGWGRNIISNHLNNPKWKLYGGELTDEGQKSLSYFIKKYDLSNVNSFYFNWCDISNLYDVFKSKGYKEVVIYTVHSIEQVSNLDVEEYKKILNLPFKIKFFHIEPCAWQWTGQGRTEWNQNFKEVLDTLEKENLIKNLNISTNGCKLNLHGSGLQGVSITYEKV